MIHLTTAPAHRRCHRCDPPDVRRRRWWRRRRHLWPRRHEGRGVGVIHQVCNSDPGARARQQWLGLPSPLLAILSEVRPRSSLRHHYNLRRHQTTIEFVGDGGDILALGLGLEDGDLGFPPHSRLSHLRYDLDPVCASITIRTMIGPQSSLWEMAAASWCSG
jgi:hypothetical protein